MNTLKSKMRLWNYSKFCKEYNLEPDYEHEEFVVMYTNGTYEVVIDRSDLVRILNKDFKKKIRYIFSMNNRIIIDRILEVDMKSI